MGKARQGESKATEIIDRETLICVDGLVSKSIFPNRSRAIPVTVSEKLAHTAERVTGSGLRYCDFINHKMSYLTH